MTISRELLLRVKHSVMLFLLLFLLLAFLQMTALADDHLDPKKGEIQSVIRELKKSGYRVFAHDLKRLYSQSLFSSRGSYTFFAPPDEALYALRCHSKSSKEYMDAIKYHIVNAKLSYYSSSHVPNGTRLDTLLQSHSIRLTTLLAPGETETETLMVNNVTVSSPNLYFDKRFAAHGLTALLRPTANCNASEFWKCVYEFFALSMPEIGGHGDDPTSPMLPALGAPPRDEVGAKSTMNADEEMSSKKVDEVISTNTSNPFISVAEQFNGAESSGDDKRHPRRHSHEDDDHRHSHDDDRRHPGEHRLSDLRHSDPPDPLPSSSSPSKRFTVSFSVSLSFSRHNDE